MSLRFFVPLTLTLIVAGCSNDETTNPAVASSSAQQGTGGNGGNGGAAGNGPGGMGGTCTNTLPNEMMPPTNLSETGLYTDIATKALASYAHEFEPQYRLWSDGADKRRWVYLPECDPVIDNTDQDNWSFPVGTRMWKEFSENGVLLETRLIHRFGPGETDWLYAAYRWNDGDADATLELDGFEDVKGTEHDIPSQDDCRHCHGPFAGGGGLPSRYLGFSAIQLSHSLPGVTIASLSSDGHLMVPAAKGFTVPGNQVEQAALGYLHANCSNCHNDSPNGIIYPKFDVRVKSTDTDLPMTATYTTVVNVLTQVFMTGCTHRIAGGNLADSCIHVRMSARGSDGMPNTNQMPPIASDVQDATGLGIIEAWIATLPPPN